MSPVHHNSKQQPRYERVSVNTTAAHVRKRSSSSSAAQQQQQCLLCFLPLYIYTTASYLSQVRTHACTYTQGPRTVAIRGGCDELKTVPLGFSHAFRNSVVSFSRSIRIVPPRTTLLAYDVLVLNYYSQWRSSHTASHTQNSKKWSVFIWWQSSAAVFHLGTGRPRTTR